MSDPSTAKELDDRPAIIKEADAKETGPRFMGLPERWYDEGPLWRCPNGHVSKRYLKSEELGRPACLAGGCRGPLWLTFPEDADDFPQ